VTDGHDRAGRQAGRYPPAAASVPVRRQPPDAAKPAVSGPQPSAYARPSVDAARRTAFDVLRAVDSSDAYANLVLPSLLREHGIRGRDAAFATELTYGTLRLRGRYDAILQRASSRPLGQVDPPVLDVLRLGAHQLFGMRVPVHAAVSETVALARHVAGPGASSFVNAVLRKVAARGLDDWLRDLRKSPKPLSAEHSHPDWIVRALREALVGNGRPVGEIEDLLAAHNATPDVTLVARPGLISVDELLAEAEAAGLTVAATGRFTATAVRLAGGDPSALRSVREGRAGVQDEGSQLVALAAASAVAELGLARPAGDSGVTGVAAGRPLTGSAAGDRLADPATRHARWLDMCAGPGGKTALLGALLAQLTEGRGRLVANEVAPHRVQLVRQSVRALTPPDLVDVRQGDGREIGANEPESYDLVLVDAPCTGLGALRRRPEARWRRRPEDLTLLAPLQRDLLRSAIAATVVGGVVAYVTCSPHLAETHAVVADVARQADAEIVDAREAVQAAATAAVPDLGPGPYVQLWPHVHGTDAMFLALFRRTGTPRPRRGRSA
jgi:16S rRNA (cytosine967-C5)-methyltransferase